jgi:hypothetical protein
MEGTPIIQLRKDVAMATHLDDNDSHYSVESIKTSTDLREMLDDINDIKSKKNANIDITTKKNNTDDNDYKDYKDDKDDKDDKKKKKKRKNKECKYDNYEDYIYDFILLFIIFMLMSQQFVKNFIGTYIKNINVDENGVVPFTGIIIYGIIFVSIFISSKIFINKIIDI